MSTPSLPRKAAPAALPSITETPNELTDEIDIADPLGIVRLLRQTDAQLFNGWRAHMGVMEKPMAERIEQLGNWVSDLIDSETPSKVVMAGAGTSGRLAHFAARTWNGLLQREELPSRFDYLIAGTDLALIAAQEGAEDDPVAAVRDIERAFQGCKEGIYIGITCGLSAPYVAAQLDWVLNHPPFRAVLIGFNPTNRSRTAQIPVLNCSFADVVARMVDHPDHLIINPVYGPEAVQGSTRMKGGSLTKIILDVAFSCGLSGSDAYSAAAVDDDEDDDRALNPSSPDLFDGPDNEPEYFGPNPRRPDSDSEEPRTPFSSRDPLAEEARRASGGDVSFDPEDDGPDADDEILMGSSASLLRNFEDSVRDVYSHRSDLAALIAAGAEKLSAGGHIYYLGTGSLGLLALIDASECPPTYGDKFEDVRGFVEGGWETVLGSGQIGPSDLPHYRIDLLDYEREVLPTLTKNDLVVGIGLNGFTAQVERLMLSSLQSGATTAAIRFRCPWLATCPRIPPADPFMTPPTFRNSDDMEDPRVTVGTIGWVRSVPEWASLCVSPMVPVGAHAHRLAEVELSAKLCFNALTTGAHVLSGKVFKNRMIDLRISNIKLYFRAIGIIQAFSGCDEGTARQALHKSVFGVDALSKEQDAALPPEVISRGTGVDKIVPRAILLATGRHTYAQATEELRKDPVVRRVIERLQHNQ